MASYEIKSYVDKKIQYSLYSNDLTTVFEDEKYLEWFVRFQDGGIMTEVCEHIQGNRVRLLKIKSTNITAVVAMVNYKILGIAKKTSPKKQGASDASYKRWTTKEDDLIMQYNPEFSHGIDFIDELISYLPDRTGGAISERIKILRSMSEYNEVDELYERNEEWTVEQENSLMDVINKEACPLSYKLTARLKVRFPDKGFHNIRGKIRQLTGKM